MENGESSKVNTTEEEPPAKKTKTEENGVTNGAGDSEKNGVASVETKTPNGESLTDVKMEVETTNGDTPTDTQTNGAGTELTNEKGEGKVKSEASKIDEVRCPS